MGTDILPPVSKVVPQKVVLVAATAFICLCPRFPRKRRAVGVVEPGGVPLPQQILVENKIQLLNNKFHESHFCLARGSQTMRDYSII